MMSDTKKKNSDQLTKNKNPVSASKIASRKLVIFACIATLVFSGVINGALDGRWAKKAELAEHGLLLQQIPETIGDWVLTKDEPLDANAQEILRCYGSLTRYYSNRVTGEQVGLLLIYGPRGPVAVHVPEVCYSSVGTSSSGPPVAKRLSDDTQDSFWVSQFNDIRDGGSSFEVWYGWSTGTDWDAAKYPRFWLTHQLYKIQAAGPIRTKNETKSAVEQFLEVLVPILRNGVVSPIM